MFKHVQLVNGLRFSPDGKRLAGVAVNTYDGRHTVKVWEMTNGTELCTLDGAGGVAFSPDGAHIASTFKIWDAQTGKELKSFDGGKNHGAPGVAYSPDGRRLATSKNAFPAGGIGEVVVRDLQTGQEVMTLRGHSYAVHNIAYSPDGRRLVSHSGRMPGAPSGEIKLWDVETGQELLTLAGGNAIKLPP